jgi:hypothetical protein
MVFVGFVKSFDDLRDIGDVAPANHEHDRISCDVWPDHAGFRFCMRPAPVGASIR